MAMKERYYTVDGQMIGYKDASGRKDFLTDALGSVTAEVEQTGATKTFDGRYKPYGGDLSSTGTRGSFGWVGTWGYRGTSLSVASHYVRARHYSKTSGIWTTIDQLWPYQKAFGYVDGSVTFEIDPSGRQVGDDLGTYMKDWQNWWDNFWGKGGPPDKACKQVDGAVNSVGNSIGRGLLIGLDTIWTMGGYMSEAHGVPSINPCFDCGVSLGANWFFTSQHWENHGYAHCMFCCVLTRYYGPKCATDNQTYQNTHPPFAKGDKVSRDRMAFCKIGVGVGESRKGTCHQGCASKTGWKGAPLPPPHSSAPCFDLKNSHAF